MRATNRWFCCAYAELTPATRFTYAAQQLLTRRPVEQIDGLFNVAYAAPAVQLFVHHNDMEQTTGLLTRPRPGASVVFVVE